LLIVFTSVLVLGCEEMHYYHIPEENQPEYHSNDQFIFESDKGDIDTLDVEVFRGEQAGSNLDHYEVVRVEFKLQPADDSEYPLFRVGVGPRLIQIFNRSKEMTKNEVLETFSLATGKPMQYVHYFVLEEDISDNDITKVYYHYRFGVLQYEYADGTVMKLVSD